jgi:hypothetical protein
VVAPGDTLLFHDGRAFHLDCSRPRMLTPEERAILLGYCVNHVVARCLACGRGFHLGELVTEPLGGRANLCPQCRRDLTEMVRAHLYGCGVLPALVRNQAMALREAARNLVKETQQLRDRSEVLIAQIVYDASQRALWRSLGRH